MIGRYADSQSKIRAQHLERAAYVYVRQSSPKQVENHLESQRRQYGFAELAAEAGWPRDRIVTLDEDQGTTASLPGLRDGFARLLRAVGRSEVGMVLSLELSRLGRNSPDWAHLLYVCRFTETLVADENGIYDLSLRNDRMVLGLRGQLSELEFDTSIHRLVEARNAKASRGELITIPPAGYEVDDLGQLVKTPDEAVAHAIATVFTQFDELGTARQVLVWWRAQGLKFPVRRVQGRSHPIAWVEAVYRMILQTLRNPIYAGLYVFGKSRATKEIDTEDPYRLRVHQRQRRLPREQWGVIIRDHHPGYISVETYERNVERLRNHQVMTRGGDERLSGAPRRGVALLQGLARCGQCGRRLHVAYGGSRPSPEIKRIAQYRCLDRRNQVGEGPDCQIVGARRIDAVVVQAFLEATAPAGVEAAENVEEIARREQEALERTWRLQIEKAEYEAQRAQRQYDAVEPENRLVARSLEQQWNAKLEHIEAVRAQAAASLSKPRTLSAEERERAQRLGADLERLWHAESTTSRDRKRLLRCLIEEVQVSTEAEQHRLRIVWKGGTATDHTLPRLRRGQTTPATAEDTIELIGRLAAEFDDAQIARILNHQGRRSAQGRPFTKAIVMSIRGKRQLPRGSRPLARDPHEGPFTADEAAAQLGVSTSTIHLWLRSGVLAGHQATPGAPWRIVLSEDVRRRLTGGEAPAGWLGLTEAARRLGESKALVAYRVKSGKLPATRVTVGQRSVWRIDVSSATSSAQPGLFDRIGSDLPEEA